MSRVDRAVASSVADQLRSRARQAGWAADPVKWARDVLGVHLWSKQQEIAESIVQNKRTVVASCHGTGKALAVDTPIPTPNGFIPMGDITPGMEVMGSDGKPVKVVATTGVHEAQRYRLVFENEAGRFSVVASGDHIWPVMSSRDIAMAAVRSERCGVRLNTGLWHHRARNMTTDELVAEMRNRRRLTVPAAVPDVVPRGPRWDTDNWITGLFAHRGQVDASGRACLTWRSPDNRQPPPAELQEVRAWLTERGVHTVLTKKKIRATAEWTLAVAGDHVAGLLTDLDDQAVVRSAHVGTEDLGWRLVSVKPEGPGPVQCIQVDALDSLYLCGEAGIPTHNSMIASVLACWWVSTRPIGEAIVVSSAPTYAQVNKILWEEIRRHHASSKRGENPMIGRVTQGDEWKADDGQILAFGRKPPSGEQGKHAFQGIHRRYVLVILDECCGIGEELWTGAEAITTNEGCRILAIGNPDDRQTEFGNAFLKPESAQDWNRISVPAHVTPNFTGEPVPRLLNEVLVSKAWCEERLRAWGKDDPRYVSKVMAQFPEQSKSSLFPPALIAAACEDVPAQAPGMVLRLGVDAARFGTDQNVVVSYLGATAKVEETWTGTDTVSSAYQVLEIAQRIKDEKKCSWVEIRVDAVGLGAGVVDTLNARAALLKDPWFTVYEMHGSASPPIDVGGSVHGYGNARAYWYDQLRQSLRNGRVKIEDDDRVKDDLAIVFYKFKNGKLFIISKEEMRKDHGRSPDHADALAYATAPVQDGLPVGSAVSQEAEDAISGFMDGLDDSGLEIAPF